MLTRKSAPPSGDAAVLNVHFSEVLVSAEAAKRAAVEAEWDVALEAMRTRRASDGMRLALTRLLSSTALLGGHAPVVWSSVPPAPAAAAASSLSSASASTGTGLLNRLERVSSARQQPRPATGSSSSGGISAHGSGSGSARRPDDDDVEALRQALELSPPSTGGDVLLTDGSSTDAAAALAKRKKFNKVHSMRIMVSGSQDQQAARQVFSAEKELMRFMSCTGSYTPPKLPK